VDKKAKKQSEGERFC